LPKSHHLTFAKDGESIRVAQMDDYERDERLFETGEVEEELERERQLKIKSES